MSKNLKDFCGVINLLSVIKFEGCCCSCKVLLEEKLHVGRTF